MSLVWCLSLTFTDVVAGIAVSLRAQLEDHAEHAVQILLIISKTIVPAMVLNLHIGSLTGLPVSSVPSSVGTVWPSCPRCWLQLERHCFHSSLAPSRSGSSLRSITSARVSWRTFHSGRQVASTRLSLERPRTSTRDLGCHP